MEMNHVDFDKRDNDDGVTCTVSSFLQVQVFVDGRRSDKVSFFVCRLFVVCL